MDNITKAIVTLLKFIVYSAMFTIGTTLLLVDPTSPFKALPAFIGITLLVHAIYQDELRRIEYTIVGLYATLIVLIAVIAGTAMSSVSLPAFITADSTLSVVLTLAIVGVYFGQQYRMSEGTTPV